MSTAPAPKPKQQLDIAYFTELQRRTFDIFRYVSCHKDNFDTYSIIIESVLVDSGSFFDSLCQTFVRAKASSGFHFKQESNVPQFAKKASGANFNFADYRVLLEGEFALSGRKVNLNPYQDAFYANPTSFRPDDVSGYPIVPFQEWASWATSAWGTGSSTPWWNAFTKLKHDRLSNFRQATLGNVIHALAAAFVILTLGNELDFKEGHVPSEVYDLFLPKYWQSNGRVFKGMPLWI
jgi:hypothetical protein